MEEGQAGQSRADFINKYKIALKEARETVYWLRLLSESEECVNQKIPALKQEAKEISLILGSIVIKAKENSNTTKT